LNCGSGKAAWLSPMPITNGGARRGCRLTMCSLVKAMIVSMPAATKAWFRRAKPARVEARSASEARSGHMVM
jgi:hypothetical protein